MAKAFYTTAKNGDTVEVDHELAKSLIASRKKKPEDFMVSETVDEGTTVQGGTVFMHPTTHEKATRYAQDNPEQDTYKVDPNAGRSAGDIEQTPFQQLMSDGRKSSNSEGKVFGKGLSGLVEIGKWGYQHPGTVGMLALSPFVPFSLGGVGVMGAMGTGAEVADRIQSEQFTPTNAPINYKEEAVNALGTGSVNALTHGIFGGVGGLLNKVAKPYLAELEKAKNIDLANTISSSRLNQLEKNISESVSDADLRLKNALISDMGEDFRPLIESGRVQGNIGAELEQFKTEQMLSEIRKMMLNNPEKYPEYQLGMSTKGALINPSDEAIAREYLQLKNPKEYSLEGKGFETFKGFPLLQRGLNMVGVKDKSFAVPHLIDALTEPSMMMGTTATQGVTNMATTPLINLIRGLDSNKK